jgi:hypothetical protein
MNLILAIEKPIQSGNYKASRWFLIRNKTKAYDLDHYIFYVCQ